MTQEARRRYLIQRLLSERTEYQSAEIPQEEYEQKRLLRALFNVRMPGKVDETFLKIQDEYLQTEIHQKGITDYKSLIPVCDRIYLWQGDITTLKCGAVVNAANSQMLGCFYPNHGCIDNAIHTYAGVQLRAACAELMRKQGCEEPAGRAKITPAYNLPSDFVIHTVGPIVRGRLTVTERNLLASCYRSCLEAARENGITSIAFCCISTGEFCFPNGEAAEIAVDAVREFLNENKGIEVIFNVYKELDYEIYRELLGEHRKIKE